MTRSSLGFILRAAELLNRPTPQLDEEELKQFVEACISRREVFLSVVHQRGSPLYVIDSEALVKRVRQFREAFTATRKNVSVFYALKSNSHPMIASTVIKEGLGIDVSSGQELEAALGYGAKHIVFSGPGKQAAELELAVQNRDRVTVLMDSFAELTRLEQAAAAADSRVKAGVRLTTDESGIWRKFGIPIDRLSKFFKEAERCPHVSLSGLQFHLSWNMSADPHIVFIAQLGAVLRNLDAKYRQAIKFVDVGGGYWPEQGEWLQTAATPEGMLGSAISGSEGDWRNHFKRSAASITDFAEHICVALKKHLPEDIEFTLYTEPGRWLCHDAMHILVTVVDRKAPDVVITDGGTNAVGWERFETDYFPVINLSRPALKEHQCLVAGSLCTPHDIWGYGYFGDDIRPGDVLLIPSQGAYTYSLRQQFIKPLPRSVELSHPNGHHSASAPIRNHHGI